MHLLTTGAPSIRKLPVEPDSKIAKCTALVSLGLFTIKSLCLPSNVLFYVANFHHDSVFLVANSNGLVWSHVCDPICCCRRCHYLQNKPTLYID